MLVKQVKEKEILNISQGSKLKNDYVLARKKFRGLYVRDPGPQRDTVGIQIHLSSGSWGCGIMQTRIHRVRPKSFHLWVLGTIW